MLRQLRARQLRAWQLRARFGSQGATDNARAELARRAREHALLEELERRIATTLEPRDGTTGGGMRAA